MGRHSSGASPGESGIVFAGRGPSRGAGVSTFSFMANHATPGKSGNGGGRASQPAAAHDEHTAAVNSGQERPQSAVEASAARFVRSLHSLLVVSRIYEPAHPLVIDALEASTAQLRSSLDLAAPISLAADGKSLSLSAANAPPVSLGSASPMNSIAELFHERGLESLVFTAKTSAEDIEKLAKLLNDREKQKPGWPRLLTSRGVHAIRANVTLKQSPGETLASLVAALVAHGASMHSVHSPVATASATLDDLTAALRLVTRLEPVLSAAHKTAPKQTAETLHHALSDVEHRTLSLVLRVMAKLLVRDGETVDLYLARLAEALLIETVVGLFLAQRLAAREVRALFTTLAGAMAQAVPGATQPAPSPAQAFSPAIIRAARALLPNVDHGAGADASAETIAAIERYTDSLHEQFWEALPAREKSNVLRSPEAWCVPAPALRLYLERLAGDRAAPSGTPVREARILLVSYASALTGEEARPRRTVAAGMLKLAPLVNMLWWRDTPAEIDRMAVRALRAEASPGIAAALAELVEALANAAIEREDFAEYETILATLETAARDPENTQIAPLAVRLLGEKNWRALVDAAFATHSLDSLGRILRREPQRLVDHFAGILSLEAGINHFGAMVKLVAACGESVLGTLAENLAEPRSQRAATAIKLLAVCDPQRLVKALPRALPAWDWSLQDLAVGELSRRAAAARLPGVAATFARILPEAHDMVAPMMLDEIGLANEKSAIPMLIKIAAGELELLRDVFIRIKAVEALGRMRAVEAADLLRKLVREHQGLVHSEPAGLRAAAQEALALLENQPSSARLRASESERSSAEILFGRPRRYARIELPRPLSARIEGPLAAKAGIRTISLGGALIQSSRGLAAGQRIRVSFRAGLRQIHSTAVVRNVSPDGSGVEFLQMEPKDRERLRRAVRSLQR